MWSDIWNVSYIELRICNQVSHDHRSYERNLSNCVEKPEKVRTSTPLKSWLFQASLCNCLNCVHNCDDHGLLDSLLMLHFPDRGINDHAWTWYHLPSWITRLRHASTSIEALRSLWFYRCWQFKLLRQNNNNITVSHCLKKSSLKCQGL